MNKFVLTKYLLTDFTSNNRVTQICVTKVTVRQVLLKNNNKKQYKPNCVRGATFRNTKPLRVYGKNFTNFICSTLH